MLTTDYLRQRALFDLQGLVARYLTEEGVAREARVATTTGNQLVCKVSMILKFTTWLRAVCSLVWL